MNTSHIAVSIDIFILSSQAAGLYGTLDCNNVGSHRQLTSSLQGKQPRGEGG
jgi:hypothetical protein